MRLLFSSSSSCSSFLLPLFAVVLPVLRLRHTNAKAVTVRELVGIVSAWSAASSNVVASAATNNNNNKVVENDNEEEYESKLQRALQYFQTKSSQLLKQALREGRGAEDASSRMEIDPHRGNLNTVGDDDNENAVERELWETEFALTATKRELQRLQERSGHGPSNQDHEEEDDDDDDEAEEEEEEEEDEDDDEGDNFPRENYRLTLEEINARLQHDAELKAILDAIRDPQARMEKYGDIQSESDMASKMNVEDWHRFKYWELHAYFSCARQFAAPRPVYDAQMWNGVRRLWNEFAHEDRLDNFRPDSMADRTYQFGTDSFDPPMEAFHAGEKGRGLRAARDIRRGELVFKATNNTVIFTHGHTWRKFLFHIYERHGEDGPFDGGTACDVLLWSWVQRLEIDGPLVIVADFDNGSLLNEGRDEAGWDLPNVRCGKEGDDMCMMEYYATKDIKTGEEILCDYREFALLGAWKNMGL